MKRNSTGSRASEGAMSQGNLEEAFTENMGEGGGGVRSDNRLFSPRLAVGSAGGVFLEIRCAARTVSKTLFIFIHTISFIQFIHSYNFIFWQFFFFRPFEDQALIAASPRERSVHSCLSDSRTHPVHINQRFHHVER